MPGHADHDRIIYYCNITKADRSDRIAFHLQVAPVRSAGETHPALVLGVQIHGALGAEIAAAAAARVQAVTADELIAEKAALVHHDVGRLA